jgi:NDP-sugar pyrophosphorylase family protein
MKAGIIAAGEGSRLKSEGIVFPKPLVAIDGVPLIERLIGTFIRNGISEIVCIVNEYSIEVKEFIEKKQFPVPINFVVRTTPSSMHSLFALSPYLKDGLFLLSTVDSIFNEAEFSGFLRYAQQQTSADGVLAVTNFIDDENPLYVQMNSSNRITSFTAGESTKHPTWVTGGVYIFSPDIFQEMESVLKHGVMKLRFFLLHLLQSGYHLEGFPFSKIVDVDHAADITTAETFLRQG